MKDRRPWRSARKQRHVASARLAALPLTALPTVLPAQVLGDGTPSPGDARAALLAWALPTALAVTVVATGRCRRALGVVSSDARVVLSVFVAGPVGCGAALVVVGLWRAAPVAGAAATAAVALAVTVFVRAYGTGRR